MIYFNSPHTTFIQISRKLDSSIKLKLLVEEGV